MRRAWKSTLATLDASSGVPYGSLVAVAAAPDGTPLLLLSALALHSKNLAADPRASLLFDATPSGPQALTGPRVTIAGRLAPLSDPDILVLARRRYLARHPSAAMFVDFADFRLYALAVEWGHLVAGFGRIDRLGRDDLIAALDGCGELVAGECDIVQHMNEDHGDTLRLMAIELGGAPASAAGAPWQMLGCDPDGVDLASAAVAVRLDFPHRIKTLEEARIALIGLVDRARVAARSRA